MIRTNNTNTLKTFLYKIVYQAAGAFPLPPTPSRVYLLLDIYLFPFYFFSIWAKENPPLLLRAGFFSIYVYFTKGNILTKGKRERLARQSRQDQLRFSRHCF